MKKTYISPETAILSIQTEHALLTLSDKVGVDPNTSGDQTGAEVKDNPFDFSWE